jgi:acetyltransferase-like isoleucine patch superfamily enzyme
MLFLQFLMFALPWSWRRSLLQRTLGFDLAPTSRIGFSLVLCKYCHLESGAVIKHFTVIKGMESLILHANASIGKGNWIAGFPLGDKVHFLSDKNRYPRLVLGEGSAITGRHIVDCTDSVTIGAFSTIAGFRSQILSHSISISKCVQEARPVEIGSYCFVGTGCIILAGSRLPSYSVLAAGSVLAKAYEEEYMLYAGIPALPQKQLAVDSKYFLRNRGYVN